MASPYYAGWTIEELFKRLRDMQSTQHLGSVKVAQTNGGTVTQFDTTGISNEREIRKVISAIIEHPDFDSEDPRQAALISTQRVTITEPQFG